MSGLAAVQAETDRLANQFSVSAPLAWHESAEGERVLGFQGKWPPDADQIEDSPFYPAIMSMDTGDWIRVGPNRSAEHPAILEAEGRLTTLTAYTDVSLFTPDTAPGAETRLLCARGEPSATNATVAVDYAWLRLSELRQLVDSWYHMAPLAWVTVYSDGTTERVQDLRWTETAWMLHALPRRPVTHDYDSTTGLHTFRTRVAPGWAIQTQLGGVGVTVPDSYTGRICFGLHREDRAGDSADTITFVGTESDATPYAGFGDFVIHDTPWNPAAWNGYSDPYPYGDTFLPLAVAEIAGAACELWCEWSAIGPALLAWNALRPCLTWYHDAAGNQSYYRFDRTYLTGDATSGQSWAVLDTLHAIAASTSTYLYLEWYLGNVTGVEGSGAGYTYTWGRLQTASPNPGYLFARLETDAQGKLLKCQRYETLTPPTMHSKTGSHNGGTYNHGILQTVP